MRNHFLKHQIFRLMNSVFSKLLPLFMFLAVVSCKKDDEQTTAELLTHSDGWILVAATVSPPIVDPTTGISFTDIYATMDDCEKDDIVFLKSDGTYIQDEGAAKCDPSEPQTTTGTWSLDADGKTLTIDTETYTLVSVSKSQLKISTQLDLGTGTTYALTLTLEHP